MKHVVTASFFAVCFFLCTAASRAALSISIPDQILVFPSPEPHFVDLIFQDTGTANENLTVYDLGIRLVRPAGVTGGVNLVQYTAANKDQLTQSPNYVFSSTSTTVLESDASHLFVDFDNTVPAPADIATGKTAARIAFTVDPDLPCVGNFYLVIDSELTVFANTDAEAIPVDVSDRGVLIGCPEPAALSLLPVAGLLALRRRRAVRMAS